MTVITRFAPSPTGFLHIGGARTALFNWLFARHHGGKFLLRIEDTDRERSTDEAVNAILESMQWLGLDWDDEPIFQFSRADRHKEVAEQLLAEGKAYHCYCTPEELDAMRAEAREKGLPPKYNGLWRDRDSSEAPEGIPPVVRLKMPLEGESALKDNVQGEVRMQHAQLDDMILLRSDGTPTYMLSVVVDDHDMGITHIIRGDDHLNNAFRQMQLYNAMGWKIPETAHIPLIHGPDGAKLSKRHGALGAEAYRDMGFLPEAMRNYLLRLGWGHGDLEIVSTEKATELFGFGGLGKSPSRFDIVKLTNMNGIYIREAENDRLTDLVSPLIEKASGVVLNDNHKDLILQGMDGLKQRAKTLLELAESAQLYVAVPEADEKASKFISSEHGEVVSKVLPYLEASDSFDHETLEQTARQASEELDIKLGKIAQPLRVALSGRTVSPSVFEVMEVLGREASFERLNAYIRACQA